MRASYDFLNQLFRSNFSVKVGHEVVGEGVDEALFLGEVGAEGAEKVDVRAALTVFWPLFGKQEVIHCGGLIVPQK